MRRLALLLAVLALSLPAAASVPSEEGAPLLLGGREILTFEAPDPDGVAPLERTVLAQERLYRALSDARIGPDDVRARKRGSRYSVLAGDLLLFEIGPADAKAEGLPLEALTERWTGLLKLHFGQVKQRDFALRLLMKYLLALTYPLLLVAALLILVRVRRSGLLWIHLIDENRPSPFALGRFELISVRGVKLFLRGAFAAAVWLAGLAALYAFLLSTFYYFPATRGYATRMSATFADIASTVLGVLLGHFIRFVLICLVFGGCYAAVRALDRLFDEVAAGRVRLQPYVTVENADTVEFLVKGLTLLTAAVVIVLILPAQQGQVVKGLLILIGLAGALASVPVLRNAFAGFVLAFLNTHRRGALLRLEGREVSILRRGLLFTLIRFPDGHSCTVPNETILNSPVFRGRPEDLVLWAGRLTLADKTRLSDLQQDLENWVREWGEHSQVSLIDVRGGEAEFELLVPYLQASSEVFLSVAVDGLKDLLEKHGCRLVDLRPR